MGHNCLVGENGILCSQVGLSGTTTLGRNVTLTGQVGTAGHLSIGDGVTAVAQSGIPSSIDAGRIVAGSPAVDVKDWMKYSAVLPKLPEMVRELRALRKRLDALEGGPPA